MLSIGRKSMADYQWVDLNKIEADAVVLAETQTMGG